MSTHLESPHFTVPTYPVTSSVTGYIILRSGTIVLLLKCTVWSSRHRKYQVPECYLILGAYVTFLWQPSMLLRDIRSVSVADFSYSWGQCYPHTGAAHGKADLHMVWCSNACLYWYGIKSITQLMFNKMLHSRSKRLHVSAGSGHHQVFVIRHS
jgi:hypothetical protein